MPEVLLHPSVIERFAALRAGAVRRGAAHAAHQPAVHRPPGGPAAGTRRMCRCRGSGPRSPTARRRSPGISRWRTPSPPLPRRMRAAGLVCLGAGAGLIRADLRAVRGTDVICRSGGVIVAVRGARPRAVPVLSRYHGRLLAAARVRRDRAGQRRDRSRPPEHHHPADPVAGRRGRAAPAGHLPAARHLAGRLRADCSAWPRSCTPPGSPAPSGSATCSPAWNPPGSSDAVRLLGAARRP